MQVSTSKGNMFGVINIVESLVINPVGILNGQ